MPIILTEQHPTYGKTYLWSLKEEAAYFKEHLAQCRLDIEHTDQWHKGRQKEWLCGRYLLARYLHHDLSTLVVDDHGKPSFADIDLQFSISHTPQLVGLMVHPQRSVGIDLQIETDKIPRVAHKYCHDDDYAILLPHLDRQDAEHYLWSIKESVYKAHPYRELSYRDQIRITAYHREGSLSQFEARVFDARAPQLYLGEGRRIGRTYFVKVISA